MSCSRPLGCRGLSLLETLMAMALGAMILVPLLMGFNLALDYWGTDSAESQMLQHARMAMQRITSELKYAAAIGDRTYPTVLEFYTRTLVNDDWQAERIRYQAVSGGTGSCGLKRRVDMGPDYLPGPEYIIAGSIEADVIDISVCPPAEHGFEVQYYKLVGSGLVQMTSGEDGTLIDAVEVKIKTYSPKNNKSVCLYSLVKLRNK